MHLIKKQTIKSVARLSTGFFYYQKVIALLALSVLILLVVRVYFSNQLAVSGSRVGYSNSKLADLKKEKSELENQLSQKSSLSYIESKAATLGFVKIGKIEVISGGGSVALGQ
jgi:hypothetical protein